MSTVGLPPEIDLDALSPGEWRWSGRIPGEWLGRLSKAVHTLAWAEAEVQILRDHGAPRIRGHAGAALGLVCERCLKPFETEIAVEFEGRGVAVLTHTENAGEAIEEIELVGDRLDLRELLEDELMLAMPVVPRHEDEHCDGGHRSFGPEVAPAEKISPFSALESLRSRKRETDD